MNDIISDNSKEITFSNDEEKETTAEILVEHNKSLVMLKELLTNLNDSNTELRQRVADLEARVAYFTNDQPQIIPPGIIQ